MAFIPLMILVAFMWVVFGMLILIVVGSFVLEIFLSRMKNPWAGLILPGFTFCFASALFLIGMPYDLSEAWFMFCRINIPTVIYLFIYFFFRKRRKKSDLALQKKAEDDKKVE
ncbi:MAG TPA: hypothetical protein H9717_06095 [Candidatus Eisenbergiella merdipullorum]|uniref:Uncharacterized protein n=1 Tax=Candidatus Eisenbergiella merdipullorum TaxID=2838553 RepID=A0A9D2I5J8_9FIRM|nr:hypothetical protein [Candidatus Eisenbergiella merdipullorum]